MEEAKKEVAPGLSLDPAVIRTLGSLLSGLSQKSAAEQPKESEETPAKEAAPTSASPAGGDGLSSLLANPAIPELLPKLLPLIKPVMASATAKKEEIPSAKEDPSACREHLLLALKPFLSSGRQNAVDTLLTVARLGNVLQLLK